MDTSQFTHINIKGTLKNCTPLEFNTTTSYDKHLHVFNRDIFEYGTEVHIPHSLIIPDFRGKHNSTKSYPLPVSWRQFKVGVCQQSLQIYLSTSKQPHIRLHKQLTAEKLCGFAQNNASSSSIMVK